MSSSLNVPPKPAVDPAIIERAPVDAGSQMAARAVGDDNSYLLLVGDLAARVDAAESENIRLKAKKTVDDVKAAMMEPYANGVFWFVIWYCIVVGAIVVLDGFGFLRFHLSDAVLGIIAGSTAVSVIGLIGIVVSGLFGVGKSSAK